MWWLVGIALVIALIYLNKKKKEKETLNLLVSGRPIPQQDDGSREQGTNKIQKTNREQESKRIIYDYLDEDGVPCLLYRFEAILDFTTTSQALKEDGTMAYLKRPGGNSDDIYDSNGVWRRISNEFTLSYFNDNHIREERYKYVGGSKGYVKFLLGVREIYENKNKTPTEKKEQIKEYCDRNRNLYLCRTNYEDPWDTLLIEVLGTISGIGNSRVALLHDNGIKTIGDLMGKTDDELSSIKGIGKKTLADLRLFVTRSTIDPNTQYIEKDEEHRANAKRLG